ncbi:MAG: hypothetical protein LBD04_04700 [Synergistaceae bacterium]|nr:hypothetical protein [Synergistaceae bacterium]
MDLIVGIDAKNLIVDRGYGTDKIIGEARKAAMEAATPPKRNLKKQRLYDKYIYKLRHMVENAFSRMKRVALWAGVL